MREQTRRYLKVLNTKIILYEKILTLLVLLLFSTELKPQCISYSLKEKPLSKENLAVMIEYCEDHYLEEEEIKLLKTEDFQLLLIQGTNNWEDKILEANFSLENFEEACSACKIHKGYHGAYKKYKNFLKKIDQNIPLIIAGHSKGASYALLSQYIFKGYNIHHIYAFSPAKIGNEALQKKSQEPKNVSVIIAEGDPVPSLPFSWSEINAAQKTSKNPQHSNFSFLKKILKGYNFPIKSTMRISPFVQNKKNSVTECILKLHESLQSYNKREEKTLKSEEDLISFLQNLEFDFQDSCYTVENHLTPYTSLANGLNICPLW